MSATNVFKGSFVNNDWVTAAVGTIAVTDPATGTVCGTIDDSGAAEADSALVAAQAASAGWAKMGVAGREEAILKYAETLKAHRDEIVGVLVQETGKVVSNAQYDFDMLVDCLGYHLESAKRCNGEVIPSPDGGALSYTRNTPVGVVVAVLTWNFPLLNLGYKLGPILASGCTCVIKPSEVTPLATSMCVELIKDTGIPAGVVNLVNGTGLSLLKPLCSSTIPRLLTTIGSTTMGRRMIENSHTSVKRFSLELGGDAPVMVFADSDLEGAVADIVGLKYANGGQICVSPNRVLVEEAVYERFLELAAAKAKAYVFGSGDDSKTPEMLQPVVSEQSLERLLSYVADATSKGARLIHGGKRVDRAGFFMEPTILADATDDMKCSCEEIFGPILSVRPFKTADEAFATANNTEYGLSAYVYTASLDTMMRAEQDLMCGNVMINGAHYSIELPHGGVKQSGYGKDISHLCLRDYMDVRRISIKRR